MKHKTIKTCIRVYATALTALMATCGAAYANDIADSTLGRGVANMLRDASSFLVILSPVAGALAWAYFMARKSMADEQDGKMWQKRSVTAAICGVAGMLGSAIIALISGYFV